MSRCGTTTQHRSCLCPVCGAVLSASTALGHRDAKPLPGDYSLCLQCGAVLIYKFDLTMRVASHEDLAKLDYDNLVVLHQAQMARRKVVDMFPAPQESRH